jgi:hypothetical protein
MNGDKQIMITNAIRGPIILITIGTLFLLDRMTPLSFGQTWPIILIVVGALTLAGRGSRGPRDGYTGPGGPGIGGQR